MLMVRPAILQLFENVDRPVAMSLTAAGSRTTPAFPNCPKSTRNRHHVMMLLSRQIQ